MHARNTPSHPPPTNRPSIQATTLRPPRGSQTTATTAATSCRQTSLQQGQRWPAEMRRPAATAPRGGRPQPFPPTPTQTPRRPPKSPTLPPATLVRSSQSPPSLATTTRLSGTTRRVPQPSHAAPTRSTPTESATQSGKRRRLTTAATVPGWERDGRRPRGRGQVPQIGFGGSPTPTPTPTGAPTAYRRPPHSSMTRRCQPARRWSLAPRRCRPWPRRPQTPNR